MNWMVVASSEFARYRAEWDRLNAVGPNSGLLHSDFIEPLLQHFGDERVVLAIGGPVGAPHALALLHSPRFGCWETFQPSQLPVGPWLNLSEQPLPQVLDELARVLLAPVITIALTQQDPAFYTRPAHSHAVDTLDYIHTARITIDQPFTTYWQQRSKNLRHNLNRQFNRLEREGIQPRLERLDQPALMAAGVRDYGVLESAGWKSEQGTAIHPDNAQGRFYTALLERFCRRGMGRIYRYWYNDQLVTTDLCIVHAGTLIILKTTFDESITTSSPAMLMRRAYFADIFAEGDIHTIEFYGQVMDWHTKLTEDIRTLYHVNYYPLPAVNALYRRLRAWRRACR